MAASKQVKVVHLDIAEPFKPNIDGCIHYLSFIDDLTGLTCIGCLKTKTAKMLFNASRTTTGYQSWLSTGKFNVCEQMRGREYLGGMKPHLWLTRDSSQGHHTKHLYNWWHSRESKQVTQGYELWHAYFSQDRISGGLPPTLCLYPWFIWASIIKGDLWKRSYERTKPGYDQLHLLGRVLDQSDQREQ